jgi:hypothetical protein
MIHKSVETLNPNSVGVLKAQNGVAILCFGISWFACSLVLRKYFLGFLEYWTLDKIEAKKERD